MAKQQYYEISNFSRGVAPSSFLGMEEIRGLNAYSRPGTVTVNNKLKVDNATFTEEFIDQAIGGDSFGGSAWREVWAIDNGDKVYKKSIYTAGQAWTEVTGYGTAGSNKAVIFWKNHWFIFKSTSISIYDRAEAKWINAWSPTGGINLTNFPRSVVHAGDDKLYFTNGQYTYSIEQVIGQTFDPENDATYTVKTNSATSNALDLPSGWVQYSLKDISSKLYICANNFDTNESRVFVWNKTADSYEYGVSYGNSDIIGSVVGMDGLLWVFHGDGDKVSYANTSYIKTRECWVTPNNGQTLRSDLQVKLPKTLFTGDMIIYPSTLRMFNGRIYFATSYLGTSSSQAIICSIKNGQVVTEHTEAGGTTGAGSNQLLISSLIPVSDKELQVATKTGAVGSYVYSQQITDLTRRYTGYSSYVTGAFIAFAKENARQTFPGGEIRLTKALATNEGVRVEYRTEIDGEWTVHQTFTSALDSFSVNSIPNIKNIQIRIAITTPSEDISTPELFYARFPI